MITIKRCRISGIDGYLIEDGKGNSLFQRREMGDSHKPFSEQELTLIALCESFLELRKKR